MDSIRSVTNIVVLFIEVFFVCISILFLIGAVLSTPWAWFGIVFTIGGFIYSLMHRQQDVIDRNFYFIIGLLFTFILAFIDIKL